MIKVCHVTSAHDVEDDRIFLKECVSLVKHDFEVYLVEKGKTYDKEGVHIIGFGDVPNNRLKRMIYGGKRAIKKAIKINADIYHLHDPELLLYAHRLKNKGKIVFFDSHEDVPAQINDKGWILKPLRPLVAKLYRCYETYIVKKIDAVITATPHISEQFAYRAKRIEVINNFPVFDDIQYHDTPFSEREAIICYVGRIDESRGEKIMVEAMKKVDGTLLIAGDHEILTVPEFGIEYLGKIDRTGVNLLYGKSIVGLCILKPTQNYYYSQPIKMFEYMAAGIPFICSNFPLWVQIADESGAGVCVDPSDPVRLTEVINDLLLNRDKAEKMGRNGYQYVINKCSWSIEEKKLISLYNKVYMNYHHC